MDHVEETVAALQAAGRIRTVGILCKTASRARDTAFALGSRHASDFALITTRNDTQTADVMVLPSYLAKGMEFDQVIVVGADAQRYTTSAYDTTLLYIAATRALHRLMVLWVGAASPLLPPRIS